MTAYQYVLISRNVTHLLYMVNKELRKNISLRSMPKEDWGREQRKRISARGFSSNEPLA